MKVIRLVLSYQGQEFQLIRHIFTDVGLPPSEAGDRPGFQVHARDADGNTLSATGIYVRDHMEEAPESPGESPRRVALPETAAMVVTLPDHPDIDHVAIVQTAPEPHASLKMGAEQLGMLSAPLVQTELARFLVKRT